jgi:hypothetical protein
MLNYGIVPSEFHFSQCEARAALGKQGLLKSVEMSNRG